MILLHKQTWNRKHARIVRPIKWPAVFGLFDLGRVSMRCKIFSVDSGVGKSCDRYIRVKVKNLVWRKWPRAQDSVPCLPNLYFRLRLALPSDSFFSQVSTVSPKVRRLNCVTTTPILMMMKRKRCSRIRETRRPQSIVRLSRSMERRTSNSSEC